jgi:tetratricopeptide (TPR) repeat protein
MDIRLALAALVFVSLFSSVELTAQNSKTTQKKTAAPKTAAASETRERRTDAKSSPAAVNESPAAAVESKVETPLPAEAPSSTPVQPVQESKTEPKTETLPAQNNVPETPTDPVTVLRDQITAASGAERIRLQLKLVEELLATNKNSEALSELRLITTADAFDPQSFYNAGNSLARLGDNNVAIEAYRKAIDQRKGNYSRALNNLGVVLLRIGRWDESYDALLSASKLESFRYAEASYNLGRLYAARGQSDLAVREWRRALTIDPHHTAAADALARVGTDERVVVQQDPVARVRADKPASIKSPTTSDHSPKPLVLDATSFELLQQARTFNEKGNTQDSVDTYRRLLSRESGYFPPANLELSFALISLKRYDEASSNLQLVANRDGARYPLSYFHLARVYELQGDLKQAEMFFSYAVSAFGTSNSQFLLDVSRVREKQGDFKGALEAMERYLTVMQQQGQEPSWSAERLTALRQKIESAAKP